MLDALVLAPAPTVRGPEACVRVAAVRDEREVVPVRDRNGVQPEGRELDLVRGPLVVVCPGVAVDAEREATSGDERLASAECGRGRIGDVGKRIRRPVAELQRREHRLEVLVLVLDDYAVHVAARQQAVAPVELDAVEDVERPMPDSREVEQRGLRLEDRQVAALIAGVREGLVEVAMVGERLEPADATHEPELLEVAHVGEIPRDR